MTFGNWSKENITKLLCKKKKSQNSPIGCRQLTVKFFSQPLEKNREIRPLVAWKKPSFGNKSQENNLEIHQSITGKYREIHESVAGKNENCQ